jgi:hypothetical protein
MHREEGVSETSTTKVIPRRDGCLLRVPVSPLIPFDRLPRFTAPLNSVSPPSQLSIRFEPNNLTGRPLIRARYGPASSSRSAGKRLRPGNLNQEFDIDN